MSKFHLHDLYWGRCEHHLNGHFKSFEEVIDVLNTLTEKQRQAVAIYARGERMDAEDDMRSIVPDA